MDTKPGSPPAITIQYGKSLERNLRAAQKRVGTTSDAPAEHRAVRDAQIALDTFSETMSRLLLDTQAVA